MSLDAAPLLRTILEQAFDHRSWHGTTLLGSLRSVSAEIAAWRPQPERHNIWELALHAAFWKYRAHRRITEAPPRSFELRGSDWFARPQEISEAAWQSDLQLLKSWHARLLRAVDDFDPARLSRPAGGSGFTYAGLITGVAAHDLYHAGQIQLLRRLHQGAAPADLPGSAVALPA